MSDWAPRWLFAFVLTQAVEVPIYRVSLKGQSRWLLYAFAASAITHPFVAVVFPWLFSQVMEPAYYVPGHTAITGSLVLRASIFAVLAETFAVVIEWRWLLWVGASRPLQFALLANLASSLFGLALTLTTGWP